MVWPYLTCPGWTAWHLSWVIFWLFIYQCRTIRDKTHQPKQNTQTKTKHTNQNKTRCQSTYHHYIIAYLVIGWFMNFCPKDYKNYVVQNSYIYVIYKIAFFQKKKVFKKWLNMFKCFFLYCGSMSIALNIVTSKWWYYIDDTHETKVYTRTFV